VQELKQHNIRVVAIYPHYVETGMTDEAPVDSQRLIRPEDIAQAALLPFRMSPSACPTKIVVENAVPVS
jgi:NAD(P)-dependent dehydrogenase (short-subunit alcohol dehydrogenase family)